MILTTVPPVTDADPARFQSRAMHPEAAELAENIAHAFTESRFGPALSGAALIARRAVDLADAHAATVEAHVALAREFGEEHAAQVEARLKEGVTEAARCVLVAAGFDAAKVAPVDFLPLARVLIDADGPDLDPDAGRVALALVADAVPEA